MQYKHVLKVKVKAKTKVRIRTKIRIKIKQYQQKFTKNEIVFKEQKQEQN